MVKALLRLAVVLALAMLASQSSSACTCGGESPGACPAVKNMGIVFVGTVGDIENPPDDRKEADHTGKSRYRFRVDENINGMDKKEVDVYSGRGDADCSYHFQLGKTYLVFPYDDQKKLQAIICSDTQPIETAEPFLSELRARRDGKPHASLYGVLRRTQQPYDATSYEGYDRPIADVKIELVGKDSRFTTTTDGDGVYRFYATPGDKYRVSLELPSGLELAEPILDDKVTSLTLANDACEQVDLPAMPTAGIHGRVLDENGLVLKKCGCRAVQKG